MLISIDGQTFRKANEGVEVIYDDVDVPVYAEPGEVHITLTNRRSRTEVWAGENDLVASKVETVDEMVQRLTVERECQDASGEFDEAGFRAVVEKHWLYHSTCHTLLWLFERNDDGVLEVRVAPVFQEILGGREDGQKVWTAFEMPLSNLFQERSLSISDFGLRSYCTECTPIPFVGVRGHFKDQPFVMTIYLQPLPETEPKEIIDRISHEVRTIKEPDQ